MITKHPHKTGEGQKVSASKEHQINGTRLTANITGTFNFDWNAYSQFVLTPTGAVTLGNTNLPTGTNSKEIKGIIKAGSVVTLPANWNATADSDAFDNTLDNHFRAWVSAEGEVTFTNKNKANLNELQAENLIKAILVHNNHINITATWDDVNGQIILSGQQGGSGGGGTTGLPYGNAYNTSTIANTYLGSPSIYKAASGRLIASHDYFGSATTNNKSDIYYSDDSGSTWQFATQLTGMYWGKLFAQNGNVYIIGTSEEYGSVNLSRSTDNGATWSSPITVIASEQGGYHTSSISILIKDGYVITAFEIHNGTESWAKHFQSTLVLGDVSDLMSPASWSRTNIVPFDVSQLPANISPQTDGIKQPMNITASKGFLEGNIVEKQDGSLIILLRAEVNPNSNYAVSLPVTWNSTTPPSSTIGSTHTWFEMPGGSVKFTIRYDAVSDKFWSITNHNRYRQFSDQRMEGWLISSADLVNWDIHTKVVGYSATTAFETEVAQYGAQYTCFVIDGNNLLAATRVADENAANYHHANKAVFTKIENFRDIPITSVSEVSLLIDETSEVISDENGIAVIHDKSVYGNSAFMLAANNANKPSFNNGIQFSGAQYLRIKHHRKLKPANGLSWFAVVENLQSNGGERIFSSIGNLANFDNQEGDFAACPQTGFGIQSTWANYTTLLPKDANYIFAGSFDSANGHIYNFLNGANRGAPDTVSAGTWSTNKIVLSTPYVDNNHTAELRLGAREATSPLYFNGLIKALHIFPTFKTEAQMISYMNGLNAKYLIY